MCCHGKTLAKCQVALFEACCQLFNMASVCMTVPYLRSMLDVSYYYVAMILGCSFLVNYVCSLLRESLDCCKSPSERLFVIQVFTSTIVMIGSFAAFFTIHIWPDINRTDSQAVIIVLATLFCSLEMSAFGFFASQLRQLFRDPTPGSSMKNLGNSFGAAVWTGLLWLPIDFPTQAYWLFGLTGLITFLLTCPILIGFCWLSCKKDEAENPMSPSPPSSDPSKNPENTSSPSSSEVRDIGCCGRIRTFGCWMWLSWLFVLLSQISIGSFGRFLVDWSMNCNDITCLQGFNFGLYDVNNPLRIYSYLSITRTVGYLVL
jgi:hypothetical protein